MSNEEEPILTLEAAPYAWLVRPCENYWEEHTHCKTFRGRFYQYYIDGKLADCSQWKTLAKLCDNWEQNDNQKALQTLIDLEKQRYADRVGPHLANDVWEKRTEPPKNWTRTLPETHQKRIEESYLKQLVESEIKPPSFSCTIL